MTNQPSAEFLDQEQKQFDQEVATIQKWWATERFRGIRRPFTAETVASLRGSFHQEYASNQVGKKLWQLLKKHQQAKTASHTFGALDPIQVAQMAKYLETVYGTYLVAEWFSQVITPL